MNEKQDTDSLMGGMTRSRQRPVALVILSGGGFSFETKCLLKANSDDLDFIYLKTHFGGTPGEGDIPPGAAHLVPSFSSVTQRSARRSVNAFLKTFLQTFDLLRHNRIDLIIAIGCSHAIPMLLAGRIFGRKTVFIESITRVDKLSNTGKIVYYFRLANIYLVQWPNLQKIYPISQVGTIL
jgi:beta-1,4-N-acetylglucosaminyltransferase